MFSYRAMRLRREVWESVQQLAEEIYAIFQTEGVDQLRGSLDITPTDDTPPININLPPGVGEAGPGITITRGGTTITIAPEGITTTSGGVTTPIGGGGTDLTQIVGLEDAPSQSPVEVLGRILSGTGDTYQVELFANPADGSFATVTVTQLQIDEDEQIPAGTWTKVTIFPVTSGGVTTANYFMQVPVWL